jgi:hypothetical protein
MPEIAMKQQHDTQEMIVKSVSWTTKNPYSVAIALVVAHVRVVREFALFFRSRKRSLRVGKNQKSAITPALA